MQNYLNEFLNMNVRYCDNCYLRFVTFYCYLIFLFRILDHVRLSVVDEVHRSDAAFVRREGDHRLRRRRSTLDVNAAQLVTQHQQRCVSRQHRERRRRRVDNFGHHLIKKNRLKYDIRSNKKNS